jgi:hypothetical protein
MRFVILYLFLTIGLVINAKAQSTREVGTKPPAPVYQASKKKTFSFGFLKKKQDNKKSGIETQEEFAQRMKAVNRQKKKEARMAGKPEYANKLYFGHKREPKKRPNGKKKYCKICEFAH